MIIYPILISIYLRATIIRASVAHAQLLQEMLACCPLIYNENSLLKCRKYLKDKYVQMFFQYFAMTLNILNKN